MIDRSPLWAGGAGVALVAACCGIPLLAGVLGTASVTALLLWGVRILVPAIGLAIVTAALVFYFRFRRVCAQSARCDERPGTPARNPP
ncbi:MAG: hypothetical protein KGJ66_15050 [Alphaproteobacteria bacterium]|nr:hypothetical protein [Alphaproteobacteria bacterium]